MKSPGFKNDQHAKGFLSLISVSQPSTQFLMYSKLTLESEKYKTRSNKCNLHSRCWEKLWLIKQTYSYELENTLFMVEPGYPS